MLTFQVNSIPLKEVIISLANSFNVPFKHRCEEYSVNIPKEMGEGEIRGINFENGLGLIIYNVRFKEDVRLEFTLNEVHPVKFIYSLHGPVSHRFGNIDEEHAIDEFNCAIVACERNNGHIIDFSKDVLHEVVSVEIDRKTFSSKESCEIKLWKSKLKNVLTDITGEKQFYHLDNCGIFYKDILSTIDGYKAFIAYKLNLQSVTLKMFVTQLVQFDDDSLQSDQRTMLRIQELKRIEDTINFIKENLSGDLTIKNLSRLAGLNPNKLQNGFKYLYSTSVNEFVTNVRLEQANVLLRSKEYNVQDVVAAIGLESSSYFSKIYKKKYAITPKNYKNLFLNK